MLDSLVTEMVSKSAHSFFCSNFIRHQSITPVITASHSLLRAYLFNPVHQGHFGNFTRMPVRDQPPLILFYLAMFDHPSAHPSIHPSISQRNTHPKPKPSLTRSSRRRTLVNFTNRQLHPSQALHRINHYHATQRQPDTPI